MRGVVPSWRHREALGVADDVDMRIAGTAGDLEADCGPRFGPRADAPRRCRRESAKCACTGYHGATRQHANLLEQAIQIGWRSILRQAPSFRAWNTGRAHGEALIITPEYSQKPSVRELGTGNTAHQG